MPILKLAAKHQCKCLLAFYFRHYYYICSLLQMQPIVFSFWNWFTVLAFKPWIKEQSNVSPIVMVACECSFSLCKFHFEPPKRRFFTLKDFHRNKIGKYTTHKRILAFSRVFPQSTLTLFAKYGLYYKIIKKTCNYILKICATRTYIGIFEGTRSYAALRAADQDWIVGPGDSSGGYILGCSQRVVFPCFTFYNLS